MKILLLHDVDAGKQNGVSVSLGILTRELEKSGYDIRVLTLADGTKSFKDGNNYRLSSVPAFIYPGIRMRPPIRHRYIDELVAWNPDIIHTNCEFSTFLIAKHIHVHCEKTRLGYIPSIPIISIISGFYRIFTPFATALCRAFSITSSKSAMH